MEVSWDDYSQYMEKCSKPPTRYNTYVHIYMFLQGIKTMNRIWYREQSHVDIPVMSLGMGGGKSRQ